jgi:predicted TPR repeat methyltransferase
MARAMNPALDDLLHSGLQLHQRGEFEGAAVAYEQILRVDPNNANALNLLGMVHHARGRHREAEFLVRRATELAPEVPGFHNNLGNTLLVQRRHEQAEEAYRRAVELQPDYAEAHNNFGVALLGQGKVEDAIQSFVAALDLRPVYPHARNNLGNAFRARSLYRDAANCYRDAIQQDPRYAEAHVNLARTLLAMEQPGEAASAARQAIVLQPDHVGAFMTLGMALEQQGKPGEAIAVYRDALQLRPEARGIRFQLAALTGEEQFAAVPPEVVLGTFESYADTFDRHLVEKLKYRGPELVVDALRSTGALKEKGDIADLGCGTGLCGPLLRPFARNLVGVDLASNMIGRARARNVYDALFVDELIAFLSVRFAQFDVAAAADVLIYFGDLKPVLRAVAQALRPGGAFAFTLERHDGDEPYVLNRTRRFAHTIAHVRDALTVAGMSKAYAKTEVLRRENEQDVHGWVIVART